MLKALVDDMICKAFPGGRAKCPNCREELIARCGEFNIWHWAHKSKIDCGYEPETEWHSAWKERFLLQGFDIEFSLPGGFRADIYDSISNTVIELQYSPITPEKIIERCDHCNLKGIKIVWIFGNFDNFNWYKNLIGCSFKYRRYIECLFDEKGNNNYDVYIDKFGYNDKVPMLIKAERINQQKWAFGKLYTLDNTNFIGLETESKFYLDRKYYPIIKELYSKYQFKKIDENIYYRTEKNPERCDKCGEIITCGYIYKPKWQDIKELRKNCKCEQQRLFEANKRLVYKIDLNAIDLNAICEVRIESIFLHEMTIATLMDDKMTIQIRYNGYNESKFLKELREFKGIHYTE